MKKLLQLSFCFLFFVFYLSASSSAQHATLYPTNWWTGMKWNTVQILMHGSDGLNKENVTVSYPGVKIIKKYEFENSRYVAYDVLISPAAKPGTVNFRFTNAAGNKNIVAWELKARRSGNGTLFARGITSEDFIYMLMPDRFSNGDVKNDKFSDLNDTSCDRNNPFLHHGGDLQGIENHLDYFNDLGVTALWLTPVIENNTALSNEGGSFRSSYHGYHFTDQYHIDKRYGGNEGYQKMIDDTVVLSQQLTDAFHQNDNQKATDLLTKLLQEKKDGHKQFN